MEKTMLHMLKDFMNSLTEDQLQNANSLVALEDEPYKSLHNFYVLKEDLVQDGDGYMNLESQMSDIDESDPRIPKGTIIFEVAD